MKKIFIWLIILALLLGACTTPKLESQAEPTKIEGGPSEIANPASQYCLEQGGTLAIEVRGDGGQFGICYFEDNRQCEEWALYYGDCPVGGLKVTGYITSAAQYCTITGGTYAITGEDNTDIEQGTCTFKNDAVCDVWDYYNGKCSVDQPKLPTQTASPGTEIGQIVFDSTRSGPYRDIYTMNIDGSNLKRLTHGEANSLTGPWSPDGLRIVYTGFGLTNSFISSMKTDGSDQTALSSIQGSDEGFPDWSPEGQRIAFTSRRDGDNEIYIMNSDGSNPIRLTNQPGDDFAPSWSPDGTHIVFVSDRDQTAGIYDLYIMNADGSGVRRLTSDTAIDYSPDWSPDGKMIVYRSHHDGAADIYLINVDGSGLRNLTNHPSEDWAPTWSPDGSLIAFQTNRDGNWEIYQMAVDGSNPMNLTDDPADDQLPFWRPSIEGAPPAAQPSGSP
jgi:Tol biopolymer transport system component/putative hemolysin